VHDGVRLVLTKNAVELDAVADIDVLEGVALAVADFGQGFEVAGVGELVEVDHAVGGVANDVTDNRRTDEAGAAGDKNFHVFLYCPEFIVWVAKADRSHALRANTAVGAPVSAP
jgi:hypothetical protein